MIKENEVILDKDDFSKILNEQRMFREIKDAFQNVDVEIVKDGLLRPINDILDDLAFAWQGMTE